MGALANLPVGLAPGLGLNAYVSGLTLSVYLFHECRSTIFGSSSLTQ